MSIIEVNEVNYQAYTNLDIAAFSYAFGGAMGEPGGIYIVDKAGQIYHANYCWGDNRLKKEHIKDIIPAFKDLSFGLSGCEINNDNWSYVGLGYGNNLLIIKNISDGFNKKVAEANYRHSGELFQHWPGIVLGLLGKGDSNLTMNGISDMQKTR